jgi:hypothetical protein
MPDLIGVPAFRFNPLRRGKRFRRDCPRGTISAMIAHVLPRGPSALTQGSARGPFGIGTEAGSLMRGIVTKFATPLSRAALVVGLLAGPTTAFAQGTWSLPPGQQEGRSIRRTPTSRRAIPRLKRLRPRLPPGRRRFRPSSRRPLRPFALPSVRSPARRLHLLRFLRLPPHAPPKRRGWRRPLLPRPHRP